LKSYVPFRKSTDQTAIM